MRPTDMSTTGTATRPRGAGQWALVSGAAAAYLVVYASVVAIVVALFVVPPRQVQFDLVAADGGRVTSASLAGKPAVVWFWAPWCPYSRAVADDVAAVARSAGSEVQFVGVGGQSTETAMRSFVVQMDVDDFRHGMDTADAVAEEFGVQAVPSFAFVDGDGGVDIVQGLITRDELRKRVADLVG
ncbi:MAG: TlpA family protein disulfide reductase [Sporichthyaceae bacterium]